MADIVLFNPIKFQEKNNDAVNDSANKVEVEKKPTGNKRRRRLNKATDDKDKRYTCDICNSTFHHATNLNSHIKVIHQGIRPHACKLCDKRFPNAFSLKRHIISHTGMER